MSLVKSSSETALMPPPVSKRIKRPAKVLDEDDYTNALSHIIARDFFPGLLEVESQREYLDALDSNDPEWIASASRNLTEIMTPGPDGRRLRGRRGTGMSTPVQLNPKATPIKVETPGTASASHADLAAVPERPDIDVNMSLGAFQQKYTSEDNESFYRLLDKQNKKRAEKYAWMWAGNKIPAARQIAHRKRENLLADKAAEETAENGRQLARLEAGDKRPAMPETWRGGPRNAFMFTPDSVEDTHETVAAEKQRTSHAPPKSIAYDNTRVPDAATEAPLRPTSPTLSTVRDAIAGRPRPTASEATFSGSSTPRVNGYTFVDSEEPEEPSDPPRQQPPLLILGPGDSTPNPFKLHESSKRENLHHRMVDKISKGKRSSAVNKREAELRSPATPRFMSSPRIEKKGGLTPAAERLLGRVGGARGAKTPNIWEGRGKTPGRSRLGPGLTPKTVGK